jgi:hypothetical protein
VQESLSSNTAKIEIAEPKLFTMGAVLVVSAYGLVLGLPILASILVVSVLKFGIMTVLIPFLAIAATASFLPIGLGNPYVTRLVRKLNPAPGKSEESFIVQLTLSPRLRSGFRAMLEDADDIGYLNFSGSQFTFYGDSVKLSAPFDCIQQVRPHNVGLRGRFVYGRRIEVIVAGLPNVSSLEFAERSSWLLPTSKRITRQLYKHLSRT